MKEILIFLGIFSVMLLVDNLVDFKSKKALNVTYFLYNIIIYGVLEYVYIKLYLRNGDSSSMFIYIRLFYSLVMNLGLLYLIVREVLETRDYKKLFISLKIAILSVITVFLFPLTLGIFIAKEVMNLVFPNIKINYLIYNKRYTAKGYSSLLRPHIYNEKYYSGNYFNDEILNRIFSYYSANYSDSSINKKLVYVTEKLKNEENILKIFNQYLDEEENLYPVLSNVKYSLLNRYEENILFNLEEVMELEDINRFMQFFMPEILRYPKVEERYKMYIMDLSEIIVPNRFRLFQVNTPVPEEYDIVTEFKLDFEALMDEEEVGSHLYSLVKKDLIYTHIFEYFNVKEEENFYKINRSNDFKVQYDKTEKEFYLFSAGKKLGRLESEKLEDMKVLNKPFNEDISIRENKKLSKDEYIVYEIYDDKNDGLKPYLLYVKIFVKLDLTKIELEKRPDLSLLISFAYNINILEGN